MSYTGVYRPKYYDGNPWHPTLFVQGKIDTLPYQHDSIILYRGISNHELFSESGSFDGSKSILEKNMMAPSNVFYDNRRNQNYSEFSSKQDAIYMGLLSVGRVFGLINEIKSAQHWNDRNSAEGAVLELQVPTKPLWTLMAKKPTHLLKLKRKANVTEFKPYENLQELERGLGFLGNNRNNTENFRKLLKKASTAEDPKNASSFSTGQLVHWATQYPVNLDNIVGVWDLNFNSEKPNFETLGSYASHQKNKYPERMPSKSKYYREKTSSFSNSKIKTRIEEELKEVRELKEGYEILLDDYTRIWHLIDDFHKVKNIRKSKEIRKKLLEKMESYIATREKMVDLIATNNPDMDYSGWSRDYSSLINNPETEYKYLKNFRDDLVKAYSSEKNHLYKQSWNTEEINSEIKLEKVIDQKLALDVLKIPDIEPAYNKIKEEPPNWLKSYIIKELGLSGNNNYLSFQLDKIKKLGVSLRKKIPDSN